MVFRIERLRAWRPLAALVALLPAALLPAAAMAQTLTLNASSSLTDVKFTLVDLAPTDGIAAQYQVDSDAFMKLDSELRVSDGLFHREEKSLPWLTPGSTSAVDDSSSSHSAFSADDLSASGHVVGGAYSFFLAEAHAGSGDANYLRSLQLAPHTQLTIEADYLLSLSLSTPSACSVAVPCATVSAYASIFSDGDLAGYVNQFGMISVDNQALASGSAEEDGHLVLTLTNESDQWRGSYLSLAAMVQTQVVPVPVPEPASGALLGAGLLALAVAARRRARRPN